MSDVTRILSRIESGDQKASEELLPLVYDELRKLAAARMASEQPGHTLQATALVHEAFLRISGDSAPPSWDTLGHFFAAAAEAMRRILIEQARRKSRQKHGGQMCRIELQDATEPHEQDERLLELDALLPQLAREDPIAAEVGADEIVWRESGVIG